METANTMYDSVRNADKMRVTGIAAFSIHKLKDVPLMVHGDPIDKHSPYALYKDLIKDCRKYDIPLSFSMKQNYEKFYNIVLVGEDALEFFRDVCEDVG